MSYIKRDKRLWGVGKGKDLTEVVTTDLRQLLFWAGIGIAKSNSGQYHTTIEEIIYSYAQHIAYDGFGAPPEFGSELRRRTSSKRRAGLPGKGE